MTMKVDWLRGCATALVTPFAAGGAIDERRLRNLIEYQIEGGIKILIPCGTTGESATMSEEEGPSNNGFPGLASRLLSCQDTLESFD